MNNRIDRAITIVLAISALGVAASAVKSSFARPLTGRAVPQPPTYVDGWERAVQIGQSFGGDSSAPVKVVTFFDLECPACAGFHSTLKQVEAARPGSVQNIYVHFPLGYHRFALPAARGAECAAQVGKFQEWVSVLFEKRDSLGLKSWGHYALEAGIKDTSRVNECVRNLKFNSRIDAGTKFGESIQVGGTPTVLINGWRFHVTPSSVAIDSAIDASLRLGKR
jgi:protein-disulfide isomerase